MGPQRKERHVRTPLRAQANLRSPRRHQAPSLVTPDGRRRSAVPTTLVGALLCSAPLLSSSLFASLSSVLFSFPAEAVCITKLTAKSGNHYTQFTPDSDEVLDFTTTRPDLKNSDITFSAAAAFTGHHNEIDGVYIDHGRIGNASSVDKQLGGAITLIGNRYKLFPTDSGDTLTKPFLDQVAKDGGSLYQQFLLIEDGQPAKFKDKSLFQRRAIVEGTNHRFSVIESQKAMTFATFIADLQQLGARNSLYMDMGAWDEGWYRDSKIGKPIKIGLDRSLTYRQSNWLVFRHSHFIEKPDPRFSSPKPQDKVLWIHDSVPRLLKHR